jgi:pimeloyl-ACP methyl ester carboxylesterase
VPTLTPPDGVEIHWEERGEGPAVVVTSAWSGHPGVFEDMIEDLLRDHRVVTFDLRGAGRSTRSGPYDVETDTADLEALLKELGGAVLFLLADATGRGTRLVARRPELVPAAVTYGGPPLSRTALGSSDAMVTSDSVITAFREMLVRDYRGGLRSIMDTANPQMEDAEVRARVARQVDYHPQEAAVPRVRAWTEDEPIEYAHAAGDRLWIIVTPEMAGPWFPRGDEILRIIRELLPEARVAEVEDGALSRPELSAEVVRQAVRETAGAAAERK